MKIYKKFFNLFEKILFFAIILTILSCNMNTNSNDKSNKIKNIEFKINKTVGVKLSND